MTDWRLLWAKQCQYIQQRRDQKLKAEIALAAQTRYMYEDISQKLNGLKFVDGSEISFEVSSREHVITVGKIPPGGDYEKIIKYTLRETYISYMFFKVNLSSGDISKSSDSILNHIVTSLPGL